MPELHERVEVFRGAINLMPKRAGNTSLTELTVGTKSGGHAYAAIDVARRVGDNAA